MRREGRSAPGNGSGPETGHWPLSPFRMAETREMLSRRDRPGIRDSTTRLATESSFGEVDGAGGVSGVGFSLGGATNKAALVARISVSAGRPGFGVTDPPVHPVRRSSEPIAVGESVQGLIYRV